MNATSLITVQLNLVCFQETTLEAEVVSASVNFNAERTAAMHIVHTFLCYVKQSISCYSGLSF